MLKKLAAALNPFASKARRNPATLDAAASTDSEAGHVHSFSCPCEPCVDHTNELTRQRLKAQGA